MIYVMIWKDGKSKLEKYNDNSFKVRASGRDSVDELYDKWSIGEFDDLQIYENDKLVVSTNDKLPLLHIVKRGYCSKENTGRKKKYDYPEGLTQEEKRMYRARMRRKNAKNMCVQ